MSKGIKKKYNDIFRLLELLSIHYRCAMRQFDNTQPVHSRVESLLAAIDELTELYNLFDIAITSSDKKIPDIGPSILDLKTFITNTKRGLKVSYTRAEKLVRSTPIRQRQLSAQLPPPAQGRKHACSNNRSRVNQKENREFGVEEMFRKFLTGLSAALQKNTGTP